MSVTLAIVPILGKARVFEMAPSRCWLLILAVVVSSLIVTLGNADSGGLPDREELDSKYLLTNQIVELRAHVQDLELAAKTHASSLKRKDKKIRSLEKELQEFKNAQEAANTESDTAAQNLAALNSQVIKLQDDLKLANENVERTGAALEGTGADLERTRAELERARADLERSKEEKLVLMKRAELAEARADSFQLEASEKGKLVEIVNEYKTQLRQAERALQKARAGMLKAQSEAAAKHRESADAWLPPWLVKQYVKVHALVISKWGKHGAPLWKNVQRHASLKAAQARKFSKPHIRRFDKHIRPVVRAQWKKVKSTVVPQYQRIKKLAVKYYKDGKKYLSPHLSKVHESVDPYVKTVREKSKPYVDHATKILSPHLEKAGPYVKIANDHYQNVVSQATTYHEQLQDSVKGTMGKHEVLARWATKELIWFLASALLALPLVASLLVFSSVFGSKTPNQAKPQRRTASPSSSSQSNTATKKPRKPRTTTTEAKQHPAK